MPALLRGGENKVHLYKNLHPSSNAVDFNKSRCLRFQFLKLCLVKKEEKKRSKEKCKEESTRAHFISIKSCTAYLGESTERKKKMPSTDVSNQTEQIFKGSEIL